MDQKWKDFLVNGGIYDNINISRNDFDDIAELISGNYSIDAFCPKCSQKSIFIKKPQLNKDTIDSCIRTAKRPVPMMIDGTEAIVVNACKRDYFLELCKYGNEYPLRFKCSRDDYVLTFYIYFTENEAIKIGQYPSPIEISSKVSSKYSKLLGTYSSEYNKSIELYTRGYFIGSYVYLRRIVEGIVLAAHDRMQNKDGWNEDQYKKSRFSEKVKLVKSELPDFFVNNVAMYGLVSKGIHELSEDECAKMYPVIKASIEFVLNDIIAKKEQEKKRKEAQDAISKFAQKLGNKK